MCSGIYDSLESEADQGAKLSMLPGEQSARALVATAVGTYDTGGSIHRQICEAGGRSRSVRPEEGADL